MREKCVDLRENIEFQQTFNEYISAYKNSEYIQICGDVINDKSQFEEDCKAIFNYVGLFMSLSEKIILEISAIDENEDGDKENFRRGNYIQQLDSLIRWQCCTINLENIIMVPKNHPMELIITALRSFPQKLDGRANDLERIIYDTAYRRHFSYLISLADQVYIRKYNSNENTHSKYVRALPLKEAGALTEISSIRFIEKIAHYRTSAQNLRIACLGDVKEPNLIEEYYKNDGVSVEIFIFKQLKTDDERIMFRIDEGYSGKMQSNEKRIYNLMDPSDLNQLFCQFNIVFFMDEGCFYRAGQYNKTPYEDSVIPYLSWLRKLYTNDTGNIYEKWLLFYKKEYEVIGRWLNTVDTNKTAHLQFNEKLFNTIQNAMTDTCHVYLYISHGRQIGKLDLYARNVCNDENYGGKSLSVYKMPAKSYVLDSGSIDDNIIKLLSCDNNIIKIDFWKLLKSISNDYYKIFLGQEKEQSFLSEIKKLKEMYLEIDYSYIISDGKVSWRLESHKHLEQNLIARAEQFLKEIIEKVFINCDSRYVLKYIRNLFVNSMISRANTVEDLMVAYLLECGHFKGIELSQKKFTILNVADNNGSGMDDGLFEARRTILSVIKNLDVVRIRELENAEEFLLFDFRNRYCPRLGQETFRCLLKSVNKACLKLGYKESRAFNYSDLIGGCK